MTVLILVLGNPELRGDDALGTVIYEKLQEQALSPDVTVHNGMTGGWDLMIPLTDGHETLLLVDSLQGGGPPGTIYREEPDTFKPTRTTACISPHDLDFPTIWQAAVQMGYDLPKKIVVFGIEPKTIQQGVVAISEEVAAAVPKVTEMIIAECERVLSET